MPVPIAVPSAPDIVVPLHPHTALLLATFDIVATNPLVTLALYPGSPDCSMYAITPPLVTCPIKGAGVVGVIEGVIDILGVIDTLGVLVGVIDGVTDTGGVIDMLGVTETEGVEDTLIDGVIETLMLGVIETDGVIVTLGVTLTLGVLLTVMLGVTVILGVEDTVTDGVTDTVIDGVTDMLGVELGC